MGLLTCAALLSTDNQGSVVVGVSTSGPAFKAPGRVGDVPLVGSGFYAEHKVGGESVRNLTNFLSSCDVCW